MLSEFVPPSEGEETHPPAAAVLEPITPPEALQSSATKENEKPPEPKDPVLQEESGQAEGEEGEFQTGNDPNQEVRRPSKMRLQTVMGKRKSKSNQTLKQVTKREKFFTTIEKAS